MDIVLRIKEEYRKLTKSEKKVADYFIDNYKDAINESTQSIAVATDTSPATVIRFVKTLKFDGLQQLKLAIAADMDSQKPDITDEIIHQKDGLSEIVEKNKRNLINSIERLYALMDLELIEKSVDAIDSAKKVYLFGVGASGIVCYDINYKLSRIGKDVVFNNDIHLQLVNLNFITKEDACVCVSYSVAHALQAQLLKGFVHAFELSDGVGQIECGNLSSKFLNVVQQSVDVCRFGVIGFALNACIVLQGVVDLFGIFFLGFHG